jgi:DNA-binding transcriptional ArsR family regulator
VPTVRPADTPGPALSPQHLQDTAALFGLLSATVRLHVLWLLAEGERDVGTLADATGQSVATVSHHLSKLKLARLVRARRHGKHHVYYATNPHALEVIRVALGDGPGEALPNRRAQHG